MVWLLLFLAILSPLNVSAQTGFPSLRLSSSARPAGMADLSAALRGPEATNPAALSATTARAYALSHNAWIGDINHQHLHAVRQGTHNAWALRAQIWQADGIEYRTGPSRQPLGTFGAYDLATGIVYARSLSSGMRLGGQIKLLRQSISTQSAVGYGIDMGLLYPLGDHLLAGAALLNAGAMNRLERLATPLPTEGRIGLTYEGVQDLLLGIEIQKARETDLSLHAGGQYWTQEFLALRLGYQTTDSRGLSGGMRIRVRSWTVDYAYMPFSDGLGQAHQVSLQFNGGATAR